jgi:transcriptional antiterminator RfaH
MSRGLPGCKTVLHLADRICRQAVASRDLASGFPADFANIMILSPTQLVAQTEPAWFCLKALPKHEHLAAVALTRNLGLVCFSPRIRFRKETQRGPKWFVEAMFPGYLFARLIYAGMYRQVQSTPGVSAFVRFGTGVAILSDDAVTKLREATGSEELIVFHAEPQLGEPVKIANGAFQGLEAVVTQIMPSKERIKVLLDFLGRWVEAEMPAPQVIPMVSPRRSSLGN